MTGRIDKRWIADNPLPAIPAKGDKNVRGRVMLIGGAEFVPGALRLTGEAVLRAGAGKLQMATVRAAAMSLGVLVPEAAMIALPADDDGEIALGAADILSDRIERCDVVVLGPGMSATERTASLVAQLLEKAESRTVLLDAAALTCASALADLIRRREKPVLMTPHHGELAFLLGIDQADVAAAPQAAAEKAAAAFQAVVLLKSGETILAAPDCETLIFDEGCIGLATGGSGDVLAGVIGGLLAQGAVPVVAAGWGCFVHGQAGLELTRQTGRVGFLARELVPLIPRILERFRAPSVEH